MSYQKPNTPLSLFKNIPVGTFYKNKWQDFSERLFKKV
jgi:hypothetical protein